MLHQIRQIITFQKSNILRITTSDGQYVHVVDGHGQIDGIALARARRHRTLGVVLEPLGQVLGVAAVATRLAPREPFAERPTLPAAAAARLVGLRRRRPAGRGAHVQQANGAARQRFAAVRAGRHLRGGREKYIEYSEIFYICCRVYLVHIGRRRSLPRFLLQTSRHTFTAKATQQEHRSAMLGRIAQLTNDYVKVRTMLPEAPNVEQFAIAAKIFQRLPYNINTEMIASDLPVYPRLHLIVKHQLGGQKSHRNQGGRLHIFVPVEESLDQRYGGRSGAGQQQSTEAAHLVALGNQLVHVFGEFFVAQILAGKGDAVTDRNRGFLLRKEVRVR